MFESTIICGQIYLGKQGEHNARRFTFNDVKIWQELFGEGHCEVLHQRNGDSSPYPVALTIEDGVPYWYVSEVDTAISGEGKCEIRYIVNDAIVKSSIYVTVVQESLGEETTDIPEPQKAWVDQVIEAGATAKESAIQAKESAIQAEHSANNAEVAKSGAEECMAQAETHSQTAKQHSDTAKGYAKDSGGASMAASQSAEEAFRSANEARGYAEDSFDAALEAKRRADEALINVDAASQYAKEAMQHAENAEIARVGAGAYSTEAERYANQAKENAMLINPIYSNALKGTATGIGAVRIDDVSPLEHNIEAKADVDTTFKTYGKNISGSKLTGVFNDDWASFKTEDNRTRYEHPLDIPKLINCTMTVSVKGNGEGYVALEKSVNHGKWERVNGQYIVAGGGKYTARTFVRTPNTEYRMWGDDKGAKGIKDFQIELGNAATDIEEYKGPIEGTAWVYPTATVIAVTPGANIEVAYNRDINDAYAELQRAILSIGGNI